MPNLTDVHKVARFYDARRHGADMVFSCEYADISHMTGKRLQLELEAEAPPGVDRRTMYQMAYDRRIGRYKSDADVQRLEEEFAARRTTRLSYRNQTAKVWG